LAFVASGVFDIVEALFHAPQAAAAGSTTNR